MKLKTGNDQLAQLVRAGQYRKAPPRYRCNSYTGIMNEHEAINKDGEELADFFNSPKREKLLKKVARKSNEDQFESYFGKPIPQDNIAYFIVGIIVIVLVVCFVV